MSYRFETRTGCVWNLHKQRLLNFNPFLSSYSLYWILLHHLNAKSNWWIQNAHSRLHVWLCSGAGLESTQARVLSQSQGAFRKSLLSLLTSWMAWTEMGQKQIGELNIASVCFFFSPLSSRWNRAAVLKYLGAAKGSLRRYSPFGGNYISQLRYSNTLFECLHAKSERKV